MNAPQHGVEAPGPSAAARFFFLRPLFALLFVAACILVGLVAVLNIVRESVPDLALAQATVTTSWPGADPATIEKEITNRLEKKLKTLKGLKRLRSASFNSFSVVAVEFRAEAQLGEAMQLLREKVADALPDLPRQAERPVIEQVSVNDTPILTVALGGELPDQALSRGARLVQKTLERVPGIRKVDASGLRDEVVLVQLLQERLLALQLSPEQVVEKIQDANLDLPWDTIETPDFSGEVRFYGRFRELADLAALPVARTASGRVVRLAEVAQVRRDLKRETSQVRVSFSGGGFRPAVDVAVQKAPGADTLAVIEAVKTELARLSGSLEWPHGLEYRITSDQSVIIRDKIGEVVSNGWQAMLCVFVVLFFMLSWREAIIAGLSIPLTFLGALGVIYFLGFTLNELVIIGMVLALGLLVDVFILMMEGLHEGVFVDRLSFEGAALRTVRTYAMPAFIGQLTTILALAPLFGIGGVDGKFIRVIPVAAITCLVMSFLIALLVDIPLARGFFGRGQRAPGKTRVDRITERASEALARWSLRAGLRNKGTSLGVSLAALLLFVLSLGAASRLPSLLYPKTDGRNLGITVELAPDATLQEARVAAEALGEILRPKPYLESVVAFAGKKSPLSRNSIGEALTPEEDKYLVGFSAVFTPLEQRERPAWAYLPELRRELEQGLRAFPGSLLVLTPELGGSTTEDPLQVEIVGDDLDVLRGIALQVQEALARVPGATDVRDTLGPARPDVKILPNREALDFHGIGHQSLARQIRLAMADEKVGTFPREGVLDDMDIRVGTAWAGRQGAPGGPTELEELVLLRAFRPDGRTVAFWPLVEEVVDRAPLAITHAEGLRSHGAGQDLGPHGGQILGDLEPELQRLQEGWPHDVRYRFRGEAEAQAETYGSAGLMLGVAMFLVFAALALQFGSFSQPLIIMFSVPCALIGTFGGFYALGMPFSFPAMIGVISLVGIVVNDAIVMIETMNLRLRGGEGVREAAAHGAAQRLRPIVSTTVTTVAGLVPLALSSPMWAPLCLAIIFGLLAATGIALLVVPCLFLLLTRAPA